MDPQANLREQLILSGTILNKLDRGQPVDADDAGRLAELVIALDEWLKGGGFPPRRWPMNRSRR